MMDGVQLRRLDVKTVEKGIECYNNNYKMAVKHVLGEQYGVDKEKWEIDNSAIRYGGQRWWDGQNTEYMHKKWSIENVWCATVVRAVENGEQWGSMKR